MQYIKSDQFDHANRTFRVKHSFFVHTLEEEILLALLEAMDQHKAIRLDLRSSRHGTESAAECIPLQVFISTRSGRRFLCGYLRRSRRLTCFRLDAVKQVTLLEKAEDYDTLLDQLNRNRQNFWGVSFQGGEGHRLDTLSMTLQVLRHLLSVQSALTLQDIRARTYREGFEESLLSIISKIESGAWNLFERDGSLYISRLGGTFLTPLSALEKSYLKALLSDPRIGLFLDQDQLEALRDMLSSVPPLWRPEQFYYYDRFTDGDPWE